MRNACLIALVFAFIFGACLIDRSPLPPAFPGSVTPTIACPGDRITVNWDLSALNAECVRDPRACERDPLTVTINATGGMSFTQNNAPVTGSRTDIIAGTEDVVINLRAGDSDQPDLLNSSRTVNVLGPTEELNFPGSFAGFCAGNAPAWREMVISSSPEVLSPGLIIKRIVSNAPTPIILNITFDDGSTRAFTVTPGAATTDLTARASRVEVGVAPAFIGSYGADCRGGSTTEGGTPPRSIAVTVFYGCP